MAAIRRTANDRGIELEERAGKGSHRRFKAGACATTVPMHKGDLKIGTLKGIERDMVPVFGEGWLVR